MARWDRRVRYLTVYPYQRIVGWFGCHDCFEFCAIIRTYKYISSSYCCVRVPLYQEIQNRFVQVFVHNLELGLWGFCPAKPLRGFFLSPSKLP